MDTKIFLAILVLLLNKASLVASSECPPTYHVCDGGRACCSLPIIVYILMAVGGLVVLIGLCVGAYFLCKKCKEKCCKNSVGWE